MYKFYQNDQNYLQIAHSREKAMISENEPYNPSFQILFRKTILQIKNSDSFDSNQLNILFYINIAFELASQFQTQIEQLLTIGLACDSFNIAIEPTIFSKCLFISSRLLELSIKRQIKTELSILNNKNASKEFSNLLGNRFEHQTWKYFSIPLTTDGSLIENSILTRKCGISSILNNPQNAKKSWTPMTANIPNIEPNSYIKRNPNLFTKDLFDYIPKKLVVQKAVSLPEKQPHYTGITRMNVFLPEFMNKFGQDGQLQLHEVIPKPNSTWAPFKQ